MDDPIPFIGKMMWPGRELTRCPPLYTEAKRMMLLITLDMYGCCLSQCVLNALCLLLFICLAVLLWSMPPPLENPDHKIGLTRFAATAFAC